MVILSMFSMSETVLKIILSRWLLKKASITDTKTFKVGICIILGVMR